MKWQGLVGAAALALQVCAAEHTDTYQRTFPVGTGERKLVVENINGPVRVTGDSGNDIRVTVREVFRADTPELLAKARNDVRVEMKQEGGTVRLYLDGPFRDQNNRERRRGESYHFRHEFDVQVPRDTSVNLRTVNGEEVRVANVRGDWEARNVNGRIDMTDIAGTGRAETVNGTVRVTFVENPREASGFKTLNGTIDVSFQPNLSADLRLSSMHGDAYTDFEVASVPVAPEVIQSEGGKRYRISDRRRTLRVAGGGVEHRFETLNGSIKIRKYGKQQ
jgi:DUF4097 and DUF4098 domain-containing protein YvlB